KRRLDVSYLFVSHNLNIVRLLCERVLVMYAGKFVEIGPTAAVFDAPKHPYTAALVSAIPSLGKAERRARIRLMGEPASPIEPDPRVCVVYGRCPKAVAARAQTMPILQPAGHDRAAARPFPEAIGAT